MFRVFDALTVPHDPPEDVRVKVIDVGAEAAAVYVAEPGLFPELFVKLPPAPPSDHIAAVAPPPKDPPNAAVVPP